MKKFLAILLAVVMVLALTVTAMAAGDTTLDTNGEQGAFGTPDVAASQNKILKLEKELKVYNLDENKVQAPTITYTYAIAAGTPDKSVTDAAAKHDPARTVTTPTKAGITTGVTITGTEANKIAWTTADELNADTDGVKNTKPLSISFENVVFTGAGVYRYQITESLDTGFTYDNTGVTETTGSHVRYIDVYVRPATTFTNGTTAAEWDIYGYTCFYNDEDITDANKTTVAVKTTGFVDGTTNGSTAFLADQYYTYNLTISKTVENDNYAKATHEFPFTVIFTNTDITKNVLLKTTEGGTVTDFAHTAGAPNWSGIAKLKDGGSIKYIGIPMGTDVEVYETNDVAGATYKVTTTRTNATTATATDDSVISGTTPLTAVSQTTKQNYQSTKSIIDTTKNLDDDNAHSIAITNTLVLISPTGVAMRIAPYALILAMGTMLLLFSRKARKVED